MTVNFKLDGISFTVSGTKHIKSKPGLFGFDVHSVHVEGNPTDVKPMLSCDFLERLDEAAAEAAEETIPFQSAHHVEDALSVTLAEINTRRGFPEGGAS